jgi:hypothetical protein
MLLLENVLARGGTANTRTRADVDLQSPLLESLKTRRVGKCYGAHACNFTEAHRRELYKVGPQQGERGKAVQEEYLARKVPALGLLFDDGFATDDSMKAIDFAALNGLSENDDDDEEDEYR